MVVERATAADVAALRKMVDGHHKWTTVGQYTMEMSANFHTAVAACTHNNAVRMLARSLHRPLLMSLREAKSAAPTMGPAGLAEHASFIDAMENKDVAKARRIMRAHLGRTARVLAMPTDRH